MLPFVTACEGKMTLIASGVYEENGCLHDYEFLNNKMGFHTQYITLCFVLCCFFEVHPTDHRISTKQQFILFLKGTTF